MESVKINSVYSCEAASYRGEYHTGYHFNRHVDCDVVNGIIGDVSRLMLDIANDKSKEIATYVVFDLLDVLANAKDNGTPTSAVHPAAVEAGVPISFLASARFKGEDKRTTTNVRLNVGQGTIKFQVVSDTGVFSDAISIVRRSAEH